MRVQASSPLDLGEHPRHGAGWKVVPSKKVNPDPIGSRLNRQVRIDVAAAITTESGRRACTLAAEQMAHLVGEGSREFLVVHLLDQPPGHEQLPARPAVRRHTFSGQYANAQSSPVNVGHKTRRDAVHPSLTVPVAANAPLDTNPRLDPGSRPGASARANKH